jgi:hypothetical protein
VKVKIANEDAWMRLGTNQPHSMISRELAERLKLRFHNTPGLPVVDDARQRMSHMVQIPTLTVGEVKMADATLLVEGENSPGPVAWDGTIGVNFLANYDVEVDPAHNRIALFLPNHCNGQAAYWTRAFRPIPFKLVDSRLSFATLLETQSVPANIDMAAVDTVLDSALAKSLFKFDPESDGATPSGNKTVSSGVAVPFYGRRFATFEIGDVGFRNTEIVVLSHRKLIKLDRAGAMDIDAVIHNRQPAPLAIGMHHLARLRMLIAYGEGVLYVSAADAS